MLETPTAIGRYLTGFLAKGEAIRATPPKMRLIGKWGFDWVVAPSTPLDTPERRQFQANLALMAAVLGFSPDPEEAKRQFYLRFGPRWGYWANFASREMEILKLRKRRELTEEEIAGCIIRRLEFRIAL